MRGIAISLGLLSIVAATILALTDWTGVFGGESEKVSVDPRLLPDLVTLQPDEMVISVEEGRRLLRFSNHIANISSGVLELYPGDTEFSLCGDDAVPGRHVYQRIYSPSAELSYFKRALTVESSDEMVGCMIFHPAHDHWHIDGFTQFELRDGSGLVVRGSKTSTCMMDADRGFNLAGSPADAYYLYSDCGQDTPQGISIGWVDTYDWDLPDQFIDITGVADGSYCVWSTADPDDRITELDDSNNSGWVAVDITGDTVVVNPDAPCPDGTQAFNGPKVELPPAEVFFDTLHWKSWSWNTTIDTESVAHVHEGMWSMAVTYDAAWAGLSLDGLGFDTTGYSNLRFMLFTEDESAPAIGVTITDVDGVELTEATLADYAELDEDGWYEVVIPISALGATDMVIEQIRLQEDDGQSGSAFYLDEVGFAP